MSSERSIVCYCGFNFYCQTSKWLLDFHMTIFKLKWFVERKLMSLSIAELHFSSTTTHLTVGVIRRRLLFMMFLMHQTSMTIGFILVVDSSNWKSGKFVTTGAQTSYSPTDDSYLSPRHLSVISATRIALPQQILFYTKNMFIYVCLYLFVPFVILLISPILAYVCTLLNLMVVQKQQFL